MRTKSPTLNFACRKNLLDCSVAKETKNGSCFLKTLFGASFVTLLTRLFMVFAKPGK